MLILDGADLGGQKASNAADPSSAQDLATKAYVDAHAGGGASRATATATTVSLVPGASDGVTTITLAKSYRLFSIQTSRPARVRLYDTAAHLAADASRAVGTDPASTAGVMLEYVTADTAAKGLSPIVEGVNLEAAPSSSISMAVTNNDAATGTITVTLIWVAME